MGKAPFSPLAKRLFSDRETGHKIVNAARKGGGVIEAHDGKKYKVRPASKYNLEEHEEDNSNDESFWSRLKNWFTPSIKFSES